MKTVAETTLQQLGGTNKLAAMIGANKFTYDSKTGAVTFHFKGCRKANIIKVELTPADEYLVTLYKYNSRSLECPIVKQFGAYCGNLKSSIEQEIGLYLSL